jgi:hypothetical protein
MVIIELLAAGPNSMWLISSRFVVTGGMKEMHRVEWPPYRAARVGIHIAVHMIWF